MEVMNEGTHGNEGQARDRVHHSSGPYWKRVHRQWWFWIGLFLMLLAMAIYVLSDNLAFLPRFRQPQPVPSNIGR